VSSDYPKSKTGAGKASAGASPRGPAGRPDPSPKRDSAPSREPAVTRNNTGRVTHDDRGNAIWEWSVATGSFGKEVSSQRLKKLENTTLSLADDAPPPVSSSTTVKQNPKGVAHGYSPYDSGLLVKAETPRKKDLKRLSEWLSLRKQAGEKKKDG